jgi:hypothetical protein
MAVTMTIIPSMISTIFFVFGTVTIVCLVLVLGYIKGGEGLRFWALRIGEMFVAIVSGQVLFMYFYMLIATSMILLRLVVSNVSAYLIVIAVLIYIERKHSKPSTTD